MSQDLIGYYESRIKRQRATLIRHIEGLIEDLQISLKQLQDDATREPARHGIVQGRAADIDMQCARVAELMDVVKVLEAYSTQEPPQ